jgi:hypothetical protein
MEIGSKRSNQPGGTRFLESSPNPAAQATMASMALTLSDDNVDLAELMRSIAVVYELTMRSWRDCRGFGWFCDIQVPSLNVEIT